MTRDEKGLLKMDIHLKNDKCEPKVNHSSYYLREWMRTREIAEKAYMRYKPMENQPTIHKWLVRKGG